MKASSSVFGRIRWHLAGAVFAATATAGFQARAADPACGIDSCVNLVFDGDSISAGWGASPPNRLDARVTAAVGGDVRMHNVAVGGRPVFECLRLYPQLVAPLFDKATSHNVIVFHAGDNDVAAGRNAEQTYAAFTDYVAAAHRQGWKIVVSTEFRRWDFSPPKLAELLEYDTMLRRNTAGADAVVDLDADPRLLDKSYRTDPAVFSHDGVHPSDGGYAILAGMVAPVVKQMAGR
jgi:lysophospholipase L1-like esterase